MQASQDLCQASGSHWSVAGPQGYCRVLSIAPGLGRAEGTLLRRAPFTVSDSDIQGGPKAPRHLSLSFTLFKSLMSPNFFRTTSPLFISQSLTQSPVAGFSLQLWSGGAENCLLSMPQSKQSELTGPDFKEATPQTHTPSVVTGKHTFRNHREDGGATLRI